MQKRFNYYYASSPRRKRPECNDFDVNQYMKKRINDLITRAVIGIFTAAFLVVSFGGASVVTPLLLPVRPYTLDSNATGTLREMAHLGLLSQMQQNTLEDLLAYQSKTGKSLAQILRNPVWAARLGLTSESYKATWYAANPFDLLPPDLQRAIRKTTIPFETRKQVKQWCQKHNAPSAWVRMLNSALIETTPINLWRASRGMKPYAKNGQYLEPIVIEKGRGQFEVRDGHIATDPRIIPTNSRVLLLVRINGQEKIIRAKATDIGEAIRGRHVDLPITIKSNSINQRHSILFPSAYIRNPRVIIFSPAKQVNRGRKA